MGHRHHEREITSEQRIRAAFFLNLGFTLFEVAGGIWTNSMAILSDALHDLGDTITLGMTWRFARMSGRRGDEVYTFGYRRFSLLGALLMSVVLFGGALVVLSQAIPRIISPQPTHAPGMFAFAVVGVLVNGAAALRMHGSHSLTDRIVTWHFFEDVLGWLAVLVASVVIWIQNVPILDPILSLAITLYVLWNVGKRLRETLVILLQGVPADMDLGKIEELIRSVSGVCNVHHTHLWSQDGVHHVLTTHVVSDSVDTYEQAADLRVRIKQALQAVGVEHATLEIERSDGPTCPDTEC